MGDLSVLDAAKREHFNASIGHHIGLVFGSAWVPIPGASTAIELRAERELARLGFKAFTPHIEAPTQETVMRFFKRKRFALESLEAVLFAGSVLSILHIYGKGQYIMEVAAESHGDRAFFADDLDANLARLWADFEPRLWDGQELLDYYTKTTGLTLSTKVVDEFSSTLNTLEKKYAHAVKTIPGFETFQENGEALVHNTGVFAREALADGAELAKNGLAQAGKVLGKWFS